MASSRYADTRKVVGKSVQSGYINIVLRGYGSATCWIVGGMDVILDVISTRSMTISRNKTHNYIGLLFGGRVSVIYTASIIFQC